MFCFLLPIPLRMSVKSMEDSLGNMIISSQEAYPLNKKIKIKINEA